MLRATLANQWELKPNWPWIIAIGRLDKNKNIEVLLRAIRLVANHNNHFYLIVIGNGPERGFLEAEGVRLRLESTVKFVGPIPNASAFLPAFDILCLISLKEGMPNAVMEASAAALPVIASCVGGVPALVNDEITGYLVDPGDVSQIASRILSLLNDPDLRFQMGKAGIEKMQREFSIDDMVFRFNEFYLAELKRRGL
jgi:glycosyltransferase involved in cell wall biosynthesis